MQAQGVWTRRMRTALYATGVMNLVASVAFVPAAGPLRALLGFPVESHPFYLLTAGLFVLLFGVGYLISATTGRLEPLFIGISAMGKITFFALVACFWIVGEVPLLAVVTASGDLVFGGFFLAWLLAGRD